MLVAAALVLLHRLDGGEVLVSPDQITALHARGRGHNRLITEDARCAVWLSDGRLISVFESCNRVRQLLEEARQ